MDQKKLGKHPPKIESDKLIIILTPKTRTVFQKSLKKCWQFRRTACSLKKCKQFRFLLRSKRAKQSRTKVTKVLGGDLNYLRLKILSD